MATLTATRPLADAEQDELATVDAAYTRAFGPDMRVWDAEIRALYEDATTEIYQRYPTAVAS